MTEASMMWAAHPENQAYVRPAEVSDTPNAAYLNSLVSMRDYYIESGAVQAEPGSPNAQSYQMFKEMSGETLLDAWIHENDAQIAETADKMERMEWVSQGSGELVTSRETEFVPIESDLAGKVALSGAEFEVVPPSAERIAELMVEASVAPVAELAESAELPDEEMVAV